MLLVGKWIDDGLDPCCAADRQWYCMDRQDRLVKHNWPSTEPPQATSLYEHADNVIVETHRNTSRYGVRRYILIGGST